MRKGGAGFLPACIGVVSLRADRNVCPPSVSRLSWETDFLTNSHIWMSAGLGADFHRLRTDSIDSGC